MILFFTLLAPVLLILYSCLRVSTLYDRKTDDEMQEQFLRCWKEKHRKGF